MKRTIGILAVVTLAGGTAAAAQDRPMGPPGGAPIGRSAQMLLARSAELDLTDAQIVKLAGIARRSETRQRARGAAMDSARTRFSQPGDSLARRQFAQRMQTEMEKERDLSRTELRDALAVLTPDQQARAWEMRAGPGRPGRGQGAPRGGRMGGAPRMRAPREMGGRPSRGGPDRPPRMNPDGMGGPDGMGRGGRGGAGGEMRPRRPRPPIEDDPSVYETR